ncbi:MAG: hypothetical protein LBU81_07905, partial [Methanosarcinales archaeon]|nr:hypothetical protein [Methanosarcinales archaeon]
MPDNSSDVSNGASLDISDDNSYDQNDMGILDYREIIYVNGDTITIVNNFELLDSDSSESGSTQSVPIHFPYSSNIFSNPIFSANSPTLQVNISEFVIHELINSNELVSTDFSVYLCGDIESEHGREHIDRELRFRAEKIFKEGQSENGPTGEELTGEESIEKRQVSTRSIDEIPTDEAPEDADENNPPQAAYNIIIYPIQSQFAPKFNKPAVSVEYDFIFSDETYYPDFKEELVGSNAIYSFAEGALQSVYWYDAEADELNLKSAGSVDAYEPEFILDLSDLQDFRMNCIFYCPERLSFDSVADIDWNVMIGDSEMNASDYLMTYSDCFPDEDNEDIQDDQDKLDEDSDNSAEDNEDIQDGQDKLDEDSGNSADINPEENNDSGGSKYPYFISFNSSALDSDLLKKRNVSVQFYPVIVFENYGEEESVTETKDSNPDDKDKDKNKDEKDKNKNKDEKDKDKNKDKNAENEDTGGNENTDENENPDGNDSKDENEELNNEFTVIDYSDKAYKFKLKRLYQSISTTVDSAGQLQLVGEKTEITKPLLSSMIFPASVQEKLSQNSLVLSVLDSRALNDADEFSGYTFTPETDVLSVMDIGFEENGGEINDLL